MPSVASRLDSCQTLVDACKEARNELNSIINNQNCNKEASRARDAASAATIAVEQACTDLHERSRDGAASAVSIVQLQELCTKLVLAIKETATCVQVSKFNSCLPFPNPNRKQLAVVLKQLRSVEASATALYEAAAVSELNLTKDTAPSPAKSQSSHFYSAKAFQPSATAKVAQGLYVRLPTDIDSGCQLGHIWWYQTSMFGVGQLMAYDVSNSHTQEMVPAAPTAVSLMHLDRTLVWMIHAGGHVVVWDADSKQPISEPLQVFASDICAIATDGRGNAWLGSKAGNIRAVQLTGLSFSAPTKFAIHPANLSDLTTEGVADGRRSLSAASCSPAVVADLPERDARAAWHSVYLHQGGAAHRAGPVQSLSVWRDRMWSSGGKMAGAHLREWSVDGSLRATHVINAAGPARSMCVITNSMDVDDRLPPASSTSSGDGSMADDPYKGYQLLTSHEGGGLTLWEIRRKRTKPLCSITPANGQAIRSPAVNLVICAPMQAGIVGYANGHMMLFLIPDLDTITRQIQQQRGQQPVVPVKAAIVKAHSSGLRALSGSTALATVSNGGSVRFWEETDLLEIGRPHGIRYTNRSRITVPALDESVTLTAYSSIEKALNQIPVNTDVENGHYAESRRSSEHDALLRHSRQSLFTDTCEKPPDLSTHSTGAAALSLAALGMDKDKHMHLEGSTHSSYQPHGNGHEDSTLRSALSDTNLWVIPAKDLVFVNRLGAGAFGEVHRGVLRGAADVAIKKLQMSKQSGCTFDFSDPKVLSALKALHREVGIMSQVRHRNVLLFMGVCLEPPCIVTEFCERNNLYDLLATARVTPALLEQLHWERRINMAVDAAKGMAYLHSRASPILHRDLKSPNLLIDKYWQVKVGDFGLSRILDSDLLQSSSMCATNPRWLAPEVMLDSTFSTSADVFSFGIILWELLTMQEPYASMMTHQIVLSVTDRDMRPALPESYDDLLGGSFCGIHEYVQLMRDCWARDPHTRPSFVEVAKRLTVMLKYHKAQQRATPPPSPSSSLNRLPLSNAAESDLSWLAGMAVRTPNGSMEPPTALGSSPHSPAHLLSPAQSPFGAPFSHTKLACPRAPANENGHLVSPAGSVGGQPRQEVDMMLQSYSSSVSTPFASTNFPMPDSGRYSLPDVLEPTPKTNSPFLDSTSGTSTFTTVSEHSPFAAPDGPPHESGFGPSGSPFAFPELSLASPADDAALLMRDNSDCMTDDVDMQLEQHKLVQSGTQGMAGWRGAQQAAKYRSPLTIFPLSSGDGFTAPSKLSFGQWNNM